jgi:hypothetical protein
MKKIRTYLLPTLINRLPSDNLGSKDNRSALAVFAEFVHEYLLTGDEICELFCLFAISEELIDKN